jgi:magnesium-transporting ATPase (P-type)
VLGEGDAAVGADARLVRSAASRMQEASLTGESQAVLKDPAPLAAAVPLGDRTCMVFKGSAVAQGRGRAVATATGMATEMGRIAHLLDTTAEPPTPLQREVARIGRMPGVRCRAAPGTGRRLGRPGRPDRSGLDCFNARSPTASAFQGLFSNTWLGGAMALLDALQVAVVHVGLLNVAFGTVPLTPGPWLMCTAMGSGVLWCNELRKLPGLLRRR